MSTLDRKVIEKFEGLPETIKAKKDIDEHRKKIDDTRREIRSGGEYTSLTKTIRAAEQRLRKFDAEVRGRDGIKSLGELKASFEQKRRGLEKKKREFLAARRKSGEHKDEYKNILAELAGIDRAIGKEKKRMRSDNIAELAKIGKRLYEIEIAVKWWRYDGQGLYAQRAGLTPNPFVISVDTRALELQQGLKFSTTVDWDYRVREEISGVLPTIMKKWLERVRGY